MVMVALSAKDVMGELKSEYRKTNNMIGRRVLNRGKMDAHITAPRMVMLMMSL
jgi:hypothetical protein